MQRQDRRSFLHTSAAAAAAATLAEVPAVHAAETAPPQAIRIGLIGCGGRGTGALFDALGAATRVIYPAAGYHTEDVVATKWTPRKDIEVVALADLFPDRLNACKAQLEKIGIRIPAARSFVGFEAYKKLLELPEINYVIQATPPHFRPEHLYAAVEAGKNVFIEKPAAVDVPGVRRVMAAGELARKKNLGIACGTQRRHLNSYRECIQRIRDGALGDIVVYGRCYWNGGQIWVIDRQPEWSDIEYQIRNWNHFTWMSGDHYVEQHVHNLDVMNWALGAHPIRAVAGVGGRQVRTGPSHGQVYDHFAVEFEYPNGVRVFSQARQIDQCENKVEEALIGTLGESNLHNAIRRRQGAGWRFRGSDPNPYQQEHLNLIASIRAGKPLNEAQAMAESTMTGILGREAVYSGRGISWDEAMKATTRLGPARYEFGPFPTPAVPMPGKYRLS